MHQVVRGEQQYPGRDHRAKHGGEPAGRGAHGEGPALSVLAAVLGAPPFAQPGRQRGAPGSPAVARRRGHAELLQADAQRGLVRDGQRELGAVAGQRFVLAEHEADETHAALSEHQGK